MINPIDWIKSRLDERTSWDGAMLIAIGVIVLIAGPFAKIAAYGAIAVSYTHLTLPTNREV